MPGSAKEKGKWRTGRDLCQSCGRRKTCDFYRDRVADRTQTVTVCHEYVSATRQKNLTTR